MGETQFTKLDWRQAPPDATAHPLLRRPEGRAHLAPRRRSPRRTAYEHAPKRSTTTTDHDQQPVAARHRDEEDEHYLQHGGARVVRKLRPYTPTRHGQRVARPERALEATSRDGGISTSLFPLRSRRVYDEACAVIMLRHCCHTAAERTEIDAPGLVRQGLIRHGREDVHGAHRRAQTRQSADTGQARTPPSRRHGPRRATGLTPSFPARRRMLASDGSRR